MMAASSSSAGYGRAASSSGGLDNSFEHLVDEFVASDRRIYDDLPYITAGVWDRQVMATQGVLEKETKDDFFKKGSRSDLTLTIQIVDLGEKHTHSSKRFQAIIYLVKDLGKNRGASKKAKLVYNITSSQLQTLLINKKRRMDPTGSYDPRGCSSTAIAERVRIFKQRQQIVKEAELTRAANKIDPRAMKVFAAGPVDRDGKLRQQMLVEFCPRTLEAAIKRGELSEYEFLHLLQSYTDCLAKLHENGICHFDIKADNLFIRRNGTAVVGDFGCGYDLRDEGDDASIRDRHEYLSTHVRTGDTPPSDWDNIHEICVVALCEARGSDRRPLYVEAGKFDVRQMGQLIKKLIEPSERLQQLIGDLVEHMCLERLYDRPSMREVASALASISLTKDGIILAAADDEMGPRAKNHLNREIQGPKIWKFRGLKRLQHFFVHRGHVTRSSTAASIDHKAWVEISETIYSRLEEDRQFYRHKVRGREVNRGTFRERSTPEGSVYYDADGEGLPHYYLFLPLPSLPSTRGKELRLVWDMDVEEPRILQAIRGDIKPIAASSSSSLPAIGSPMSQDSCAERCAAQVEGILSDRLCPVYPGLRQAKQLVLKGSSITYLLAEYCPCTHMQALEKELLSGRLLQGVLLNYTETLKEMHDAGTFHLNIKENNLLIDWEGCGKISDLRNCFDFHDYRGAAHRSDATARLHYLERQVEPTINLPPKDWTAFNLILFKDVWRQRTEDPESLPAHFRQMGKVDVWQLGQYFLAVDEKTGSAIAGLRSLAERMTAVSFDKRPCMAQVHEELAALEFHVLDWKPRRITEREWALGRPPSPRRSEEPKPATSSSSSSSAKKECVIQ